MFSEKRSLMSEYPGGLTPTPRYPDNPNGKSRGALRGTVFRGYDRLISSGGVIRSGILAYIQSGYPI